MHRQLTAVKLENNEKTIAKQLEVNWKNTWETGRFRKLIRQ